MNINISLFNKINKVIKKKKIKYKYEVMDIKNEGSLYFNSGKKAHSYAKKLERKGIKSVIFKYNPKFYDRDFNKGIIKKWYYVNVIIVMKKFNQLK